MVNYKKELKSALWDDFERGIITEQIMEEYFKLFNASNTHEYYRGLYMGYQVLVLKLAHINLQLELMEG